MHTNQSDDGNASSTGTCSSLDHGGIGDIENLPPTANTTCIAYASTRESGPRQARTGYNMLVIRNAGYPSNLPPLARQHISWAGRLSDRTSKSLGIDDDTIAKYSLSAEAPICASVADLVFSRLQINGFVFAETTSRHADELRLDVRPKSLALPLIQQLQHRARNAGIPPRADTDSDDPYDGPMRMTQSLAKAAFVLSAVFDSSSVATETYPTACYWGVSQSANHAHILNRINDFAKKEVQLAKPEDTACDDATPTSRAYYKMSQIFEEYLLPSGFTTEVLFRSDHNICTSLDLGASPGGWTQVLWQNWLRPVISVDPGLLAQRVKGLEGVQYIKGDFDGENEVIRQIAARAPYAAIVCDANITHGIDDKIRRMVGRVADELLGRKLDDVEKGQEAAASLIALPAVFVLTLKFAYKSEQSLKRNYASATKMIPDLLRSIVDEQCRVAKCNADDITCQYSVVHLHANSDSERTVLAIFDATKEGPKSKRKRASSSKER